MAQHNIKLNCFTPLTSIPFIIRSKSGVSSIIFKDISLLSLKADIDDIIKITVAMERNGYIEEII